MTRFECPSDHSHGENSTCRAMHGCKCDACREYGRLYEYWRSAQHRQGKVLRVPALGSIRRIHALQALGWSARLIGEHAGYSDQWAPAILRRRYLSTSTAAKVSAVYDALSMRTPPTRTASERMAVGKTRAYAARQGWLPPLAWNDEDLDRPEARPAERKEVA